MPHHVPHLKKKPSPPPTTIPLHATPIQHEIEYLKRHPMPDIWVLCGDSEDGSTAEASGYYAEASGYYRAVDLIALRVPADMLDPVRDFLKESFQAEAEATNEPVDTKGVAEEKDEVTKPVAWWDLTSNTPGKPPAASNAAAVHPRDDIETGKIKKDQVEEEGDNENEGGSEEAPCVSPSKGDLATTESNPNQKGVNPKWLKWHNELLGVNSKEAREEQEEKITAEVLEVISAIIVEKVGPAVAEQEDSYDKFGTMVSRCKCKWGQQNIVYTLLLLHV